MNTKKPVQGSFIALGILASFVALIAAHETAAQQVSQGIAPGLLVDPYVEFPRVPESWEFNFPDDHSAHTNYRTEGWSFSGVLRSADNDLIGMRLSILRLALSSEPVRRESEWATTEIYFGLLRVSDPSSEAVISRQRRSRAALGLAGTAIGPFNLWIESWQIAGNAGSSGDMNAQIDLRDGEMAMQLALINDGPLADSNGLRADSSQVALPFVYYIQPLMNVEGTIDFGAGPMPVTGRFSLEHAWGEVPLPGAAVERDSFTLFMEDGRVIQLYRTLGMAKSTPARIEGAIFAAKAAPVLLSPDDAAMTATEYWISKENNRRYGANWSLVVPDYDLELTLETDAFGSAVVMDTPTRLSAVRVIDSEGAAVGIGLMELVGQQEN